MKRLLLKNRVFSTPSTNWDTIIQKCQNRSGVYRFINNINNKYYIGSSVNLYNRIRDYNQPRYQLRRRNTFIVRAIKKYGIENFTIAILEYTDKDSIVTIEQNRIDTYKAEYNLLTITGYILGYIHSEKLFIANVLELADKLHLG